MERRTFLKSSGTTLVSVLWPGIGRSNPATRAAIVIGIDKAGGLPVLQAAASGALEFANWLKEEDFEVYRFIDDEDDAIKVDPIFETVNEIVSKGIYEQLVVYFSGHGFLNSYSELWMLSGAPNNPNQAVSLLECERLSKRTGIPNVVFISDACRSTSSSLAADSVRGSVIFPGARNSGNVTTKVDVFLATQEGDPAFEVGVDVAVDNYYGIYTASFLDAFKFPEETMVSEVNGVEVVLNKDLEDYLRRDVNRRAQQVDISLTQRPETSVLSDEYIGRVRRPPTLGPGEPPGGMTPQALPPWSYAPDLPPPQPTLSQVADLVFKESGYASFAGETDYNTDQVRDSNEAVVFRDAQEKILRAEAPLSFETQTGLSINGVGIAQVSTNTEVMEAVVLSASSPGIVRLDPKAGRPASVVIRFSDGSGTVVAGLPGYVGTIVVDDGRTVSVSYVRSGVREEQHLKELRSLVATSARFGTFRIGGQEDERDYRAQELANRIRVMKAIDPTLGIYAAYAYDDADLPEQIESVWNFMLQDINGQIFDVAMLAGQLSNVLPEERRDVAPFCPMLSEGWGLLRIANVILHPDVEAVRDHIEPALWSTFRPQGMEILMEALDSGRLE